jgi:hypothetical protein
MSRFSEQFISVPSGGDIIISIVSCIVKLFLHNSLRQEWLDVRIPALKIPNIDRDKQLASLSGHCTPISNSLGVNENNRGRQDNETNNIV